MRASLKHGHHRLFGLSDDLGRPSPFLCGVDRRGLTRKISHPLTVNLHWQHQRNFQNGGLTHHDVNAFCTIDPDFFNAAGKNGLQVMGVQQHKICAPKRMIHPETAKLFEMHSKVQLMHTNRFEHGKLPAKNKPKRYFPGRSRRSKSHWTCSKRAMLCKENQSHEIYTDYGSDIWKLTVDMQKMHRGPEERNRPSKVRRDDTMNSDFSANDAACGRHRVPHRHDRRPNPGVAFRFEANSQGHQNVD